MARHSSTLAPRSSAGAPTLANRRSSQKAENTADATCSDGQALPAVSSPLMMAISGWLAQSMAGIGTAVGKSQKIARQSRHNAAIQMPNTASARKLPISAGGIDT